MEAEDFHWAGGEVAYWSFSVDLNSKLVGRVDALHEDLIQVHYGDGVILDVGWYPEHDVDGRFRIVVISNEDWDNPRFQTEAKDLEGLRIGLVSAIAFAAEL